MHLLKSNMCIYVLNFNWCFFSEAAGSMSAEDRKKYAEQVTMQFWQAVGGNADEFEGLSSDSD